MRVTLSEAISRLRGGDVVALPTETVYGLAARADQPMAIERIYTLKGRPAQNPLIVHVASGSIVAEYVDYLSRGFEDLANRFWPGPMTLVLTVSKGKIPPIATAGLPTAAFRVPAHPLTLKVLEEAGPLVMPSANLSGKPSATAPEHVEADFGGRLSVLDGGQCRCGLESTILCWEEPEWVIARLGAIGPEEFVEVLGYRPKVSKGGDQPLCPGQMYRHYAPRAHLELSGAQGDCIVGFSDRKYEGNKKVYSIGRSSDPNDAAKKLYAVLRQLDVDGVKSAWVDMDIPHDGLWMTLRERLFKAASK